MEMIQPNKLKQAQQELATISFSNGFELPKEINEKEAKYYYACVGVRARDTADGFSKQYEGSLVWATINKWMKMKRQLKEGVFKREFGDMFDKIVIVHDPTYKPKKEEKPKGLSPKQKGQVNKLLEDNKSAEEIAEITGFDLAKINMHLNK
jgi:hypothetical protein